MKSLTKCCEILGKIFRTWLSLINCPLPNKILWFCKARSRVLQFYDSYFVRSFHVHKHLCMKLLLMTLWSEFPLGEVLGIHRRTIFINSYKNNHKFSLNRKTNHRRILGWRWDWDSCMENVKIIKGDENLYRKIYGRLNRWMRNFASLCDN